MKVIALVDCDSFFVSCEQKVNPELKGKPVCVLSNKDGCVISRSKEAKKMGVRMGQPYFLAKVEFPGAIFRAIIAASINNVPEPHIGSKKLPPV